MEIFFKFKIQTYKIQQVYLHMKAPSNRMKCHAFYNWFIYMQLCYFLLLLGLLQVIRFFVLKMYFFCISVNYLIYK